MLEERRASAFNSSASPIARVWKSLGLVGAWARLTCIRTDGSPGVDGHADLVIVQAEHAVEDFDLPLRGAFDLLAEVEGRVRRVHADGDVDQGFAISRHVAGVAAPRFLEALSDSRTATKIAG